MSLFRSQGTGSGATVDEDAHHTHGTSAELIRLIRTFEHENQMLQLHLEMAADENQTLAAFNRKYYAQILALGGKP